MGKVVAQAIMSLDGYVEQDNTMDRLFDWLQNGGWKSRPRPRLSMFT